MTKTNKHRNREAWLGSAIEYLRADFKDVEIDLPMKIRAATGLPAGGVKSAARGQTWDAGVSSGGWYEIFIRPELADDQQVLTQLVAQLISTALPPVAVGYPAEFRKTMSLIGLLGKPSAPYASAPLQRRLNRLADDLGPFPHDALDTAAHREGATLLNRVKPQKGRLLGATCPTPGCGYAIWLARSTVARGMPPCPLHLDLRLAPKEDPAAAPDSSTTTAETAMPASMSNTSVLEQVDSTESASSADAVVTPGEDGSVPGGEPELDGWIAEFTGGKPPEEIRNLLKAAHGKYSSAEKCWKGPRTDDTGALEEAVRHAGGQFRYGA